MKNNKNLKKKILYRSIHRGFKEMDLLLGSFVKKNIEKFDNKDLDDLDKLLSIEDEIIYKWYFNKKNDVRLVKSNVSEMLRKFKL
jgi:antitoxin CptB